VKTNESKIQVAIMQYLESALPSFIRAAHVPNGGRRDSITGAKLKREGVKAGFPDIVLIRDGGSCALIEVKASKGRLSDVQKDWADWAGHNAVPYAVCRSIGDVQTFLLDLNIPLKARVQI
jgi:hypothetical protein